MPDGTLNHFTAAAGAEIFRGDRLPAGPASATCFFAEPVGRIVRRAKIVVTDGLTQLQQRLSEVGVHPLDRSAVPSRSTSPTRRTARSTSPTCTPASSRKRSASGPGSYLRAKVEQYELDKVSTTAAASGGSRTTGMDAAIARSRSMYGETPAQLVAHLEHPERLVARHGAEAARPASRTSRSCRR